MEEVDITVLAAKSVFSDMIDKCPPAERCRDAFDRTSKATIKMANQTGGFGAPVPRKRRNNVTTTASTRDGALEWKSADSRSSASMSGQTSRAFNFDMMPDNLSSPAVSAAGDVPLSPRLPRSNTFESDGFGLMGQSSQPALSPSDTSLGGDGSQAMDAGMLGGAEGMARAAMSAAQPGAGSSAPFLQNSFPSGAVEYSDPQTMEFLQSLQGGATPTDFSGLDPLGFGLNWDGGINQEYGEGQPVSLFDGFFFGGQSAQQ